MESRDAEHSVLHRESPLSCILNVVGVKIEKPWSNTQNQCREDKLSVLASEIICGNNFFKLPILFEPTNFTENSRNLMVLSGCSKSH